MSLLVSMAWLLLFIWLRIPLSHELLSVDTGTLYLDKNNKTLYFDTSFQEQYQLPLVEFRNISPYFTAAAIALEDKDFFRHRGIDFSSLSRALYQNIRSGKVISGASTLSQQLAKKILNNTDRTITNKLREMAYAIKLETQFSKEEIFAMWANRAPFSSNIVGIHAASAYFFHVRPEVLSLAQAAYLAGIPQNPEAYSPFKKPNAAKARQEYVLDILQRQQLILEQEQVFAQNETLEVNTRPPQILAPHFVIRVKGNANKTGTLRTSLDLGIQQNIESIIRRQLEFLQDHNANNAALIVIENQTGAIRAYVGNADFYDESTAGQVDVLRSFRQAGSTLKPFLYYLAFRDLDWTADTPVLDEPTSFRTALGTEFAPKNFDLGFRGEMTVRDALAESRNIPAVTTLAAIGEQKFFDLMSVLDVKPLQSAEDAGLSAALGAAEIRLIDLASAYSTLAREGKTFELCFLEPCVTQSGKQEMNKNLVLEISQVLADNVARIGAFGENSALEFDIPVAVKTGTSRNFKDNFAIGYTPAFTVLAWVGNADGSAMKEISGVTGAGPILHDTVALLSRLYPLKSFPRPAARAQSSGAVPVLRILSPLPSSQFVIDPSRAAESQKIRFATNISAHFFLDDVLLGTGEEILWIPEKGSHHLTVSDDKGNSADSRFTVK